MITGIQQHHITANKRNYLKISEIEMFRKIRKFGTNNQTI